MSVISTRSLQIERDVGLLNVLMLSMLAVLFFTLLSMIVQRYLLSFVAVRYDCAALDFLTRKLLALPMTYFHARKTGDIRRRLLVVSMLRRFLVENGVTALTAFTQIAACNLRSRGPRTNLPPADRVAECRFAL